MAEVISNGQTGLVILENSEKMISTGKEFIVGLMEEYSMALGEITKSMGQAHLHGRMARSMSVSMSTIRNRDMVYLLGQTERAIKDSG
jgi:hypothetical protein